MCSLCGFVLDEAAPFSVPLPENPLSISELPFAKTCGDLEGFLPFLEANSTECVSLQAIGTLCGCPIRDGACEMCGSGGGGGSGGSNVVLPNDNDLSVLEPLVGSAGLTCTSYRAVLHTLNETDSLCLLSKDLVGDYCGCNSVADNDSQDGSDPTQQNHTDSTGDNIFVHPTPLSPRCSFCPVGEIPDANQTLNVTGIPFKTCGQMRDAIETLLPADTDTCSFQQDAFGTMCGCELPPIEEPRCSFCLDGSPVPEEFLNKEISFLDPVAGLNPTCGLIEAIGKSQQVEGSDTCLLVQSFGAYCGCPAIEDHCVLCEEGDMIADPDITVSFLNQDNVLSSAGVQPTCEFMDSLQYSTDTRSTDCFYIQHQAHVCGCNKGIWDYGIAAKTKWKQALLAWIPRFTGGLSTIVSTSKDSAGPRLGT